MNINDLNSDNREQTKRLILYLVSEYSGSTSRESNLRSAILSAQMPLQSNVVSAFLYLNCLDQLGDLFCEPDGNRKENNDDAIKRALVKFGYDLGEKKLNALVSLRHALAHKMGLVNQYNNVNYKFIIKEGNQKGDVVVCPQTPWDGVYKHNIDEILKDKFWKATSYIVNVSALGEITNTILLRIAEQCETLHFALKPRKNESSQTWNNRYQKRMREISYRFFVYYDYQ